MAVRVLVPHLEFAEVQLRGTSPLSTLQKALAEAPRIQTVVIYPFTPSLDQINGSP